MGEPFSKDPGRRYTSVVLVAWGYAVVAALLTPLGTTLGPVPIRPAAPLPVVLGIAFGPVAVAGVAAGTVLLDLFYQAVSLDTAVLVAGHGVAALLGARIWDGVAMPAASSLRADLRASFARYWLAAAVAVLGRTAVVAFGSTVLGRSQFTAVAFHGIITQAPAAFLVGPVLLFGTAWGLERVDWATPTEQLFVTDVDRVTGLARSLVVVFGIWIALGVGVSVLQQDLRAVSVGGLVKFTPFSERAVEWLVPLFVRYGWALHLLLGAVGVAGAIWLAGDDSNGHGSLRRRLR